MSIIAKHCCAIPLTWYVRVIARLNASHGGRDQVLWNTVGSMMLEMRLYGLARRYFECALKRSGSHWPTLEKLASTLYAIGDTCECMALVRKMLKKVNAETDSWV